MRRQLIAKIHIAKKDLALDDDSYRHILVAATGGKVSCADMSEPELEKVVLHFKERGWKPAAKKRGRYSPKTRGHKDHDMIDKIRALWIDMSKTGVIDNGSEEALDAWVKRTTVRLNKGIGIDRVDWLRNANTGLVFKVVESLKKWRQRVVLNWKNEDLLLISKEQKRTDKAQPVVIQCLLDRGAIFWWPIFQELGIEDSDRYCSDRRRLIHENDT